jgi:hypothetical protein
MLKLPSSLLSLFSQKFSVSASSSMLARAALNPQPLPPKEAGITDGMIVSRFDRVGLNPQPLPPKDLIASIAALKHEALR